MNEVPRQKLCEIITTYGTSVLDEPRKVENLLCDLAGEYKREIFALVNAQHKRVPDDLLASATGAIPIEVLLAQLYERLHDALPISQDDARWTVNSWALALGVISGPSPPPTQDAPVQLPPPPIPPTPPVSPNKPSAAPVNVAPTPPTAPAISVHTAPALPPSPPVVPVPPIATPGQAPTPSRINLSVGKRVVLAVAFILLLGAWRSLSGYNNVTLNEQMGAIFWGLAALVMILIVRFATGDSMKWSRPERMLPLMIALIFAAAISTWDHLAPLYSPNLPFSIYSDSNLDWSIVTSGVWFIPCFLAVYIIRKPGAALFCQIAALAISVPTLLLFDGVRYGANASVLDNVAYFIGPMLALGVSVEVALGLANWRRYGWPMLLLSGFFGLYGIYSFFYSSWINIANRDQAFGMYAVSIAGGIILSVVIARVLKASGLLEHFDISQGQS